MLDELLQEKQLLSVYQPLISLVEQKIVAWEALSRGPLDSPLYSPDRLFQVARREGQLVALENLSRTQALTGFARQQLPGKLFINISPDLLTQPDHEPGQTLQLVRELGLTPEQLVIELCENHSGQDFGSMQKALDHYRSMGFQVALGDLGRGYSGLRLWSELHPDYVRVEQHFVHQIHRDKVKQAFMRSLHTLAAALGTQLIAEGVETPSELKQLEEMGVDWVQGYYFARPQAQPSEVELLSGLKPSKKEYPVCPIENKEDISLLLRRVSFVSPETGIAEAVEIFRQDEELFSLPVVDHHLRPKGLLLRSHLMKELLRPFGKEIYYRRNVTHLMHDHPLKVDLGTPLETVSQWVTERNRDHLDDDFIITESGFYLGIGQVVDLLRIMTDLKIRNARQANPLTLLPGNGPIQQTLDAWLVADEPVVVCYLDLDNFKPFNDIYGYAQGDELLKSLARILKKHLHPEEDFIGHVGGDDFVVLCRSKDWQERLTSVLESFTQQSQEYYSEKDRLAGGIHAEDRYGIQRFFAFVGLSVAALRAPADQKMNAHMLASEVSHVKHATKQIDGSCLVYEHQGQQQLLWPEAVKTN
ncbi:bifunctional diguanylate cyclase/phosphodiesterase [Marinospirillum sp.]|uniref:bifunctional diguanylate cyclase/phosphodiesterase n=1 Tax=Marinospirillum sp. TaxID=2183934 RepID=UPI00286FD406|nr:bifunctional diguanylate cyclase/phosphodiesterase [Marinospirillum sp.]MDR9469026.1 bifunctional diguanylate cyclase/phosphodiesterase [Marinospirillum sp.]